VTVMAAHRQFVPVRDTENALRVEDGTMCRMPSPAPGPLRGEPDDPGDVIEYPEKRDGRLSGLTDGAGLAMGASRSGVEEPLKVAKPGSDRN
jgi:hypothetical protein